MQRQTAHTCSVAPVSEGDDPASDDEPEPTASSQPEDEEAGPSGITPTSSRSTRLKKDKSVTTVDEAIMSIVRTMKESQA